MESIISIVLLGFGIYMVLSIIGAFIQGWNQSSANADETAIKEKLAAITHIVREEQHNGRAYWFDADNDKFLAWGDTQDEIIATLKARWPEHIFYLNESGKILCKPNWIPMPFPVNK